MSAAFRRKNVNKRRPRISAASFQQRWFLPWLMLKCQYRWSCYCCYGFLFECGKGYSPLNLTLLHPSYAIFIYKTKIKNDYIWLCYSQVGSFKLNAAPNTRRRQITAAQTSNLTSATALFRVNTEASLNEVVITSVLDEDPPCVGVGGGGYARYLLSD